MYPPFKLLRGPGQVISSPDGMGARVLDAVHKNSEPALVSFPYLDQW